MGRSRLDRFAHCVRLSAVERAGRALHLGSLCRVEA